MMSSDSTGESVNLGSGSHNLMLVFTFIIVLAIVAWITSRLLRLSLTDSTAIEMEVIVRNVNLGVLIKASMFPAVAGVTDTIGDMVFFTVLLYGGVQMLIAAVLITIRRRSTKEVQPG